MTAGTATPAPEHSSHTPTSRVPARQATTSRNRPARLGSSRTIWNSPVIRDRRWAIPDASDEATAPVVAAAAPTTPKTPSQGCAPVPASTPNITVAASTTAATCVSSGPTRSLSLPRSVTTACVTPRVSTTAATPDIVWVATNAPRAAGPRNRAVTIPEASPIRIPEALPAATAIPDGTVGRPSAMRRDRRCRAVGSLPGAVTGPAATLPAWASWAVTSRRSG